MMKEMEAEEEVKWRAPSNIALVKYWGKFGRQYPQNPSLSMTLTKAFTETSLSFVSHTSGRSHLNFLFEGQERPTFKQKIATFLDSLEDIFPFIKDYELTINTKNSFPHSAGIASSASSMAALALCLCSMEQKIVGIKDKDDGNFFERASMVARLGSGSACRSLWGGYVEWGGETIERGAPLAFNVAPIFRGMHDAILIIDSTPKNISSRAGHGLMKNHAYAPVRYKRAGEHLKELCHILVAGDMEAFIKIVESEALELHGLMMTSSPPYLLLRPQTLSAIAEIKRIREEEHLPICFTLDAGPNIHLLYPNNVAHAVEAVIEERLAGFCEEGKWSKDGQGEGPVCLRG